MTLKSGSSPFIRQMLNYGDKSCQQEHANEREAEDCECAHNSFEQRFHPFQYMHFECSQNDHLVLYKSQQHRQTGI